MARTRDPIIRLSKHDVLPPETLAKAAQVILDAQLRHVERTRKLRFDVAPTGQDPEAHALYVDDMPETRLLQKLWLRYHSLCEAGADEKVINDVLKMCASATSQIADSRTTSFNMILSVVQQNQKAQEHKDKMDLASRARPDDLDDATIAAMAEAP